MSDPSSVVPENVPEKTPRLWVAELTFSDGSSQTYDKSDITVIVGPNNAGKSETLRAIQNRLASASQTSSPVLTGLRAAKDGTSQGVLDWLGSFAMTPNPGHVNPVYQAHGVSLHKSDLLQFWDATRDGYHSLTRFFCLLLTAAERLQVSQPPGHIDLLHNPPVHPMHWLARDSRLEAKFSSQFRKAFGTDILVNHFAGSNLPLHVGPKPAFSADEDRASYAYREKLNKLPQLQTQGDGMRSFAGVLLSIAVGRESLILIDEPEAFLHPPQARELGRLLVSEKPGTRQIFVATHSGDVLRGMLNAGSSSIRVVRMRRDGDVNRVRQLDNARVTELWGDSLLRSSNILDGLFHEKVVVCESDSDARFYSAVADAVVENRGADAKHPDVMFTHCGGKDRVALVVRALRSVDVPVAVAVDFDVLREEQPLRGIVEAAGGDWATFEDDWRRVKQGIDSKGPQLNASEVVREIQGVLAGVLAGVKGTQFPEDARDKVRKIFSRSSPWATAKEAGKGFVPPGDATQAYARLIANLKSLDVNVVEVGELERFAKSVGNKGPKWVNEALKKNLALDSELDEARRFVASLVPGLA